ncbi:MAG TPA: hypothetical protein VLA03_11020, partial [Draconibacterium sp.]|nr:hypothetical protein [Draconibacterium sp.]
MDELFQSKEKTEQKKRNESQLNKALQDYRETKEKLAGLTNQLKKELKDVQQLEDGGIAALFYSILGNKVEKLDQERQEYLAAKLKYENCKNELEHLEFEIERLKSKIVELGEAEIKYKKLLEKKSALLKINQDDKFVKYEHLIETCLLQKNELDEAIEAGEKAL